MDYCVITFRSTHGAIYAQQILKGVAPFVTMPVLREISKGCGISVRFDPAHLDRVRTAISACDLPQEEYAFYGVTGSGADLRTQQIA